MKTIFCSIVLLFTFGACVLVAQNKAEEGVTLQFPNNPIADILATYESLTGKRIIRDANLAGVNLTIVVPKPMPKDQAIRFIEAVMLLNGYNIVPGPDDTLKVISFTNGKSPRSEGVPIYADSRDLPLGDTVVSFYMPFKFISPPQALEVFQSHLVLHPYGVITAAPTAQALIITENTSSIRQLLALRDLIDVPPAKVVSQFVTLQLADAERVAEVINKILENQKKSPQAQANAVGAGAPAPTATGQLENQLVAGETQITADVRTNRILVITRPINFPFLKDLIQSFDQAADLSEPLDRPLKYISAVEIFPVLKDLLAQTKEEASKTVTAAADQRPAQAQPQNRTNTNSSTSSGLTEKLQEEEMLPLSVTLGKTRLIADARVNSIIVIGPPESKEKVRLLLDRMDKRALQVYLATVIGKLTLTNDSELSVDLLQKFQNYSGNSGLASSSINSSLASPRIDPRTLATSAIFPASSALTLYGSLGSTLDYYVKALESSGRFSVLSRPSVFTANYKLAKISSGQEVPIIKNTTTSLANTDNVQSNIEYKKVELLLEVIPQINADKEITLKISQQNDSVISQVVLAGNSVPIIGSDKLSTTITVPNKGTVALGGLIRDSDTMNRTGIPWISRVPVIGALFRSDTKNKRREELVILIQPVVIESEQELIEAQKKEVDRATIGEKARNYGEPPVIKKAELAPSTAVPKR